MWRRRRTILGLYERIEALSKTLTLLVISGAIRLSRLCEVIEDLTEKLSKIVL